MQTRSKKQKIKETEIIYRNDKPVSIILDIDRYKNMLERLDDIEDLEYINQIKKKNLSFRKCGEFLSEYNPNV
ncbi:MAG: type II toxin-antitoxin system Phd/YefM family antitoxin [bacterium]